MAENTKIQWADHTWNPWIGCTKVSPACDHCYAEALMDTRYGRVEWGPGRDRSRTAKATWNAPLKWNRAAADAGEIATVFCLSLGDIWDNEIDPLWRHDAFDVMERTPNLLYLLLSKRIGNSIDMCDPLRGNPALPRNAALGATVISQKEWDRDVPTLLYASKTLGARFTFASVEPMLEPIAMGDRVPDWIICGGESGPRARSFDVNWARSIIAQGRQAGVSVFIKQLGSSPVWGGYRAYHQKDRKGGDMEEWDADLRVREFPEIRPVESAQ